MSKRNYKSKYSKIGRYNYNIITKLNKEAGVVKRKKGISKYESDELNILKTVSAGRFLDEAEAKKYIKQIRSEIKAINSNKSFGNFKGDSEKKERVKDNVSGETIKDVISQIKKTSGKFEKGRSSKINTVKTYYTTSGANIKSTIIPVGQSEFLQYEENMSAKRAAALINSNSIISTAKKDSRYRDNYIKRLKSMRNTANLSEDEKMRLDRVIERISRMPKGEFLGMHYSGVLGAVKETYYESASNVITDIEESIDKHDVAVKYLRDMGYKTNSPISIKSVSKKDLSTAYEIRKLLYEEEVDL